MADPDNRPVENTDENNKDEINSEEENTEAVSIPSEESNENQDNPFEIEEGASEFLNKTLQPLLSVITVSNVFIQRRLDEESISLTKDQLNIIRAMQVFGAIDYIGQSRGWTSEQLIIPIADVILDFFGFEIPITFAILKLNDTGSSDCFEIMKNGVALFIEVQNELLKKADTFAEKMAVVQNDDAKKVSKLITPSLIEFTNSALADRNLSSTEALDKMLDR